MPNEFKKVMLIDDNEIDLKINSKIISLAKLFEEIIICQSGEESLDYLNKYINQPDKLPVDVLLRCYPQHLILATLKELKQMFMW
jgi:response regulator of citrate/malate metabolism